MIDGMTGDQRFFIGYALAWRRKSRDAQLARQIATDPHSPAEFRCNGVVRNIPEFYAAFGVKEGDKLYLARERCGSGERRRRSYLPGPSSCRAQGPSTSIRGDH